MRKTRPVSLHFAPGDAPQAKLDAVVIKNRLAAARLDEALHGPIVAMLQQATYDYTVDRLFDEQGATPAQIRGYAERVLRLAAEIRAIAAPTAKEGGKAALHALSATGLIEPTMLDQFRIGADQLTRAAISARSKAGPPKRGGGKALQHERQLRFARGFIDTFRANGWPMDTAPNGLMAQLLSQCFRAAGERPARPADLLKEAAKGSTD